MTKRGKIIGAAAGLLGLGWLGLQVPPRPFSPPAAEPEDKGTVPLPAELPEPVRRHFALTLGQEVPKIETAVIWGRARFRLGPVWSPMRFKAIYWPGQGFERLMEISWFRLPLFKGRDSYRDQVGELQTSGLVNFSMSGEKIDQAQNLTLWGESLWLPSVYVTDPRLEWTAVNERTARLRVPFKDTQETFLVSFDPQSGLIRHMLADRYRGQEALKTPWRVSFDHWQTVYDLKIPTRGLARWRDEASAYGIFTIEGAVYNIDPAGYLAVN